MVTKNKQTLSKNKKHATFVYISSAVIIVISLFFIFESLRYNFMPGILALGIIPVLYGIYSFSIKDRRISNKFVVLQLMIFLMALLALGVYFSGPILDTIGHQCQFIGGYVQSCVEPMHYGASILAFAFAVPAGILSVLNVVDINKKTPQI